MAKWKNFVVTPLRCERVKGLALEHNNCTLSLVPAHINPYTDFAPRTVQRLEKVVRERLKEAILQPEVSVLLSAGDNVLPTISTRHIAIESRRGHVWRFRIQNPAWIDENWQVFSGPFDQMDRRSRRSIHLFLAFNAASLRTLVSCWYDPDVLLNPSIASSPRTISEIKKRLAPGILAFSVSFVNLSSLQLFFHPTDTGAATEVICKAAQKSKWWC